MKRGLVFCIFISLVLISVIDMQSQITGDTITGKVSESIAINITVTATSGPTLTIEKPKNHTYFYNYSLALKVDFSTVHSVWYNLDIGTNTSFTSDELSNKQTFFNMSLGSHTLYVFANNSDGTTAENVTFFVNSTRFSVNYTEYFPLRGGNSTDFNKSSYGDVQNLSGIILEDLEYGKISFNDIINVTNDEDISDNFVDINKHINISFNKIEINKTALPNFNVSASLFLYNLTFTNPRILRDGSVCSSSICTKESYSGGILKFNVTGFSTYSAEETPAEAETPSSSSGGGGGGSGGGGRRDGGAISKPDFIVEPDSMKVLLKENESFQSSLTIKNMKKAIQPLSLSISDSLKNIVDLRESFFTLQAEEEKTIQVTFNSENIERGVHTGNIHVKGNVQTKEIPIVVSIKSKNVLFDVSLDIPSRYRERYAGDELLLQVTLFNLAGVGKTNVSMDYIIKDFNGTTLYNGNDIVAVETQVSYDTIIKLPSDLKVGDYVAIVQARYEASLGSSNSVFHVIEKETPYQKSFAWIILTSLLVLTVLYFIIRNFAQHRKDSNYLGAKLMRRNKNFYEHAPERPVFEKLHALETAFKEGYISKKSYERGKSRLRK